MTGPGFVAALAVSRHLLCYLLLPVKCISQAVVVLPGLGASASGPPALGRGVLHPAVCQGAAPGHYHTPGRSSPGQLPSTKAYGIDGQHGMGFISSLFLGFPVGLLQVQIFPSSPQAILFLIYLGGNLILLSSDNRLPWCIINLLTH